MLVLNHFAVPRGKPGGTRHVELFGRLSGWRHLIVASELNHLTGERQAAEPGFLPVRVAAYRANGWRRILNWVTYAWAALIAGLRQGRIDLVYASTPHLLAPLAGWAVALVRRAPLVLEVRDLWPRVLVDMGQLSESSLVYRILTVLESFLYSRASRIVVMAEGSRDVLIARGISEKKIVYIPNGADPSDFEPSASRGVLRERFGFTDFTAIYAGAHGPANGLDLLLDAAELVRDLPIDIVLVGGGVAKVKLQADAVRRGLLNVRFIDPVAKEEIPDLLHASDLGLHVLADVELFRTAVSPNKVFDYMAAGLPVLTNCPGIVSNLVEQTDCGRAVGPHNLAVGMRDLASRTRLDLQRLGEAGRQWIAANQSREAMAARVSHLLQDVVGEGVSK